MPAIQRKPGDAVKEQLQSSLYQPQLEDMANSIAVPLIAEVTALPGGRQYRRTQHRGTLTARITQAWVDDATGLRLPGLAAKRPGAVLVVSITYQMNRPGLLSNACYFERPSRPARDEGWPGNDRTVRASDALPSRQRALAWSIPMRLDSRSLHLALLQSWFPDAEHARLWGGPGGALTHSDGSH